VSYPTGGESSQKRSPGTQTRAEKRTVPRPAQKQGAPQPLLDEGVPQKIVQVKQKEIKQPVPGKKKGPTTNGTQGGSPQGDERQRKKFLANFRMGGHLSPPGGKTYRQNPKMEQEGGEANPKFTARKTKQALPAKKVTQTCCQCQPKKKNPRRREENERVAKDQRGGIGGRTRRARVEGGGAFREESFQRVQPSVKVGGTEGKPAPENSVGKKGLRN